MDKRQEQRSQTWHTRPHLDNHTSSTSTLSVTSFGADELGSEHLFCSPPFLSPHSPCLWSFFATFFSSLSGPARRQRQMIRQARRSRGHAARARCMLDPTALAWVAWRAKALTMSI